MAVADDAFSKIVKHSSFGNSFLCTHNSDNLSPKDFVLIDANKSNMAIAIVELIEIVSAKSVIFPIGFHPRLAVLKWIVPSSFLMGGVLGYPTSFLLDTWQAKLYEVLPLRALDNGLANKCDSHFPN
jgi:hypothetical protein